MATQKKKPERLCLGCQTVRPKKELVRIVRSPEGVFSVDLTGKKPGRGAYVCRKPECFDAAVKRRQFAKSFQGPVDAEVLKALREELFPEGA
ncbi:MAG: YlxR family protein [Schwartzia sp.]|nr:YlxR family protein [Schwartzia sp. (in: firmicutes)]MBR1886786.1 YlxR family protein [Schwartzia sp. (in: firmicutes)]